MVEMQARGIVPLLQWFDPEITPAAVLDSNRRLVLDGYILMDYTFGSLFVEPRDQQNTSIPMELRNLIKEKVKSQDTLIRAHLLSINWTIEDEYTVEILYGDRLVETVSQTPQSLPISDRDLFSMFTNYRPS